jgi:glutamate-ammonia-ligase adenylyltransferase
MSNFIPDKEVSRFQREFDALQLLVEDELMLMHYKDELFKVWYASPFIRRVCVSQPEWLASLLVNGELQKNYSLDDYIVLLNEAVINVDSVETMQKKLRRARVAAFARIAWRDLQGYTSVQQTLSELSFFAEACVEETLLWCFKWQQSKAKNNNFIENLSQNIVIFALGKLGGRELNFSSDIDIVFAYSEEGTQSQKHVEQKHIGEAAEFYLKVVQLFIKVLSEQTQDGFVFRVDTRLRPFGDSGALIPSFQSIDQYFQSHGRDWERYAWIKARVVAGSREVGEQFLADVIPFVYRRYLDYGAIQSLREMKSLIDTKAGQEVAKENLKIGIGGIREIEFIAQMFQLIYGGKDSSMRARSTMKALQQLQNQELLSEQWFEALTVAYLFLRKAENNLQLRDDQQIHSLPVDSDQQNHFAFLMGAKDWQTFHAEYKENTQTVNDIYQSLLNDEMAEGKEAKPDEFENLWLQLEEKEYCLSILRKHFVDDSQAIYKQLVLFAQSSLVLKLVPVGRTRLNQFMPLFMQQLLQFDEPLVVFNRFMSILKSIVQRSTYISLLLENKNKLEALFVLIHASPWISQYLATRPLLLDELLSVDESYRPPGILEMQTQLDINLANMDGDLEAYMEGLREFKHSQTIQIAAADIIENYPIMKVSDHLSWMAEVCLNRAVECAYAELVKKYGEPNCELGGIAFLPEVLIVEYGKLGGLELGYGSDLDIVFLHNSVGDNCETTGGEDDSNKKIHNDIFFTRLVQKVVHILSTITAGGKVFDTDLRLRPHGESGPIISSIKAYENYLINDAWLWEHQALVRARAITKSKTLDDEFTRIRLKLLCQIRNTEEVRASIRDMRNKMLDSNQVKSEDGFNIKKDVGGLIDIEFIVQFLVLSNASDQPKICEHTDNIRILDACADVGVLDSYIAKDLKEIYLQYRKYLHQLSLRLLPEVVDNSVFPKERSVVQKYWTSLLHSEST